MQKGLLLTTKLKSSNDIFGRLQGKNVDLSIKMKLGTRSGEKLLITDFDMLLDLDDMQVELECLFPKNGKCCDQKYLRSCNATLAKVVIRYVY